MHSIIGGHGGGGGAPSLIMTNGKQSALAKGLFSSSFFTEKILLISESTVVLSM